MRHTAALIWVALGCAGLEAAAPRDHTRPAGPPLPPGVAFSDDFESGFTAAARGHAGWQSAATRNVAVSTDVAHGGTHSLRFVFRGKAHCQDSSAEQRFWLGGPLQEVWLEYYIYYPAGGEGGSARYEHRWEWGSCPQGDSPDNNKFLAIFGPVYQKEPTSLIQTWTTTLAGSVPPSSPGDSRIQSTYSMAGRGGTVYNISSYPSFIAAADRGRWLQIRFHFRVADFGQRNGQIQMWKDGKLILNDTTLRWFDSSNRANYLTQGYLLGWANSGYTRTTHIYIDDFRIITRKPAW